MSKILVPVDFSAASHQALDVAASIAYSTSGTITLLHVVTPESGIINSPFSDDAERFVSEELYEDLLADIAQKHVVKKYPNVHVDWDMVNREHKKVSDHIAHAMNGHDLLVMGTTGANNLMEKVVGSTTSAAIDKIQKPVIAIPQGFKFDGIVDHILIVLDYNDFSEDPLNQVLNLFENNIPKITCLDINLGHNPLIPKSAEILGTKYPNIQFEVVDSSDEIAAIAKYTDLHKDIDLVAMPTSRRSWFGRWAQRSYTENLILSTNLGIMAI